MFEHGECPKKPLDRSLDVGRVSILNYNPFELSLKLDWMLATMREKACLVAIFRCLQKSHSLSRPMHRKTPGSAIHHNWGRSVWSRGCAVGDGFFALLAVNLNYPINLGFCRENFFPSLCASLDRRGASCEIFTPNDVYSLRKNAKFPGPRPIRCKERDAVCAKRHRYEVVKIRAATPRAPLRRLPSLIFGAQHVQQFFPFLFPISIDSIEVSKTFSLLLFCSNL